MKRSILILSALVLFLATACSKDAVVPEETLPASIKEYITTHFPTHAILEVMKEREGLSTSYEVTLEGSFKLEFDRRNQIKDIEGITKLPDSVVPAKISEYVTSNYPDQFIVKWEKDDNHQEIQLDNKMELVFTLSDDFLRIDE
jgi:hypothetical protein